MHPYFLLYFLLRLVSWAKKLSTLGSLHPGISCGQDFTKEHTSRLWHREQSSTTGTLFFSSSVCIPKRLHWSFLPFFTTSRTIRNACAPDRHTHTQSLTSKNPMMTTSAESMKVSAAEMSVSLGREISAGST